MSKTAGKDTNVSENSDIMELFFKGPRFFNARFKAVFGFRFPLEGFNTCSRMKSNTGATSESIISL